MKARTVSTVVTYAVTAVLALFVGFPLLWMVISSFKPPAELFVNPPRLLPGGVTFAWYRNLVESANTVGFFTNSLIVGASTTAICLTLGTLAAYGVTRFDFAWKRTFLLGALLAYLFPAIVLFVSVYLIINALGVGDSFLGLILCHCILTFPFGLWMLKSFFETIPIDIDEAAWVDGASFLHTFARIILPLALPGIFSVGVFVFVLSWNEFLFASVLITSGDMKTIPLGIAEFITSFDVRWGEIMAMGTLATVPVVILFLCVQRYFVSGVTSGAVKG